jgi:hypothetical protein
LRPLAQHALHEATEALDAARAADPALGPFGRVLHFAERRFVGDALDRRHRNAGQPSGLDPTVAGLEQGLDFMKLQHSEHSSPHAPLTAGMGF